MGLFDTKTEENTSATEELLKNLKIFQPPSLAPFDPKIHVWAEWQERLENHFEDIDCEGEKSKSRTLLNLLGSVPYALVRALCDPAKPSSKSYTELSSILDRHYSPPVIVFRERLNFHTATKNVNESVTDWYARVKLLAVKCKFDHLDDCVRDRFIIGMANDRKIFERLCEEDNTLTLDNAFKKALLSELKNKPNVDSNVNFVKHQRSSPKSNNRNKQHSSNNNNNSNKSGASSEQTQKVKCSRCGWRNHEASSCKFKDSVCHVCQKIGHLASVCRDKNTNKKNLNFIQSNQNFNSDFQTQKINENFSNSNTGASAIERTNSRLDALNYDIYHIDGGKTSRNFYLDIQINGINFKVKCDTGAPCCLMPVRVFDEFFSRELLSSCMDSFNDYGNHPIDLIGEFFPTITYNLQTTKIRVFVTETDRPILMGEEFLNPFGFELKQKSNSVNVITEVSRSQIVENIKQEFSKVFLNELGTYTGAKVHLDVVDGTKPIFFKPRKIPLAWRSNIENKYNDLIEMGMIEPIDNSDWGTPIVPIVKPSGDLRVCGDYKVTLNKFLIDFKYPLPRIEEIFASLQGGKLFSKLDLSNAYNQLVLDDESQKLCVWSTHLGLFKMKRLPFGVKVAGAIFQKTIENLLRSIPHCINFMDDIVITGPDFTSHITTLKAVLQKLQDNGLRLNVDKCFFFMKEITYLGFNINEIGLAKNSDNIESVLHAPIPSNVSEVRAFTGLVNYYSKFIANFAEKMEPLYNLLRKDQKFVWANTCNNAYKLLKKEITSDLVLVHFDPKKPIVLTTDACDTAIAGVLSHEFPDKTLRPIAFISRSLSTAERNYATIQKEALAIIFSVVKLYQYLIGIKFILQTDHKPLISIFGENNALPVMAAARMQRWAFILSGFNYEIRHVKGTDNHADTLSRMPQFITEESVEEASYINFVDCGNKLQVNFQDVARETRRDSILSKLLDSINKGTVKNLKADEFVPFKNKADELSIESDCILWGYRTIVPSKLRNQILNDLHKSHLGIVKTKALARSYLWWPKLDNDIENLIKNCAACRTLQANPEKCPLIPWQPSTSTWSRIHMDFAGPINNFHIFILIDSWSKWPEAHLTKDMTSAFVIDALRSNFCKYGLVDVIVSDNGTQFASNEFQQFIKLNRIRHIMIAPGHPASNGQAENSVKTLKKSICASLKHSDTSNMKIILNRFLFDYRNTKHCSTNETPAKLMFGRELKTRFSLLKPPTTQTKLMESQEKCVQNAKGKREIVFTIGQKVDVRDYTNVNKPSWIPAVISEQIGPRNYSCILEKSGRSIKRHVNQIRSIGDGSRSEEESNNNQQSEFVESELALDTEIDGGGGDDDNQISVDSQNVNVERDEVVHASPSERPVRESARKAQEKLKLQRKNGLI